MDPTISTDSNVPVESEWWCSHCRAFVVLLDPGEVYPRCETCKDNVQRRSQPLPDAPIRIPRTSQLPKFDPVPDYAAPAIARKKLPKEQRYSIVEMYTQGYWTCEACGEPTRRNEQECCALCGSSQVKFIPPGAEAAP